MTDINFNITGIENLIEDLKKTRCDCDNTACNNNSAWKGRKTLLYAPRCLLPSVCLDEEGKCEYAPDAGPKGEVVFTPHAVEAAVKGQDLLNRVSSFATDYLKTEGRCQIPKSLLDEINDHIGGKSSKL